MKNKRHKNDLEQLSNEVETAAVWRTLEVADRVKAMRLLLGPHWRQLYKGVIERYQDFLGRI